MGCSGKFFGFRGGCEGAIEHQAACVNYIQLLSDTREKERMVGGLPGRKPGCFPKMVCNWATRNWLVLRMSSSGGRGMSSSFVFAAGG